MKTTKSNETIVILTIQVLNQLRQQPNTILLQFIQKMSQQVAGFGEGQKRQLLVHLILSDVLLLGRIQVSLLQLVGTFSSSYIEIPLKRKAEKLALKNLQINVLRSPHSPRP